MLFLPSGSLQDHLHETHWDVCVSLDVLEALKPGGEANIHMTAYMNLPRIVQMYYFQMWFSLIIVGTLRGLVFLPVILSLVGG
jgi:hypothetical protein